MTHTSGLGGRGVVVQLGHPANATCESNAFPAADHRYRKHVPSFGTLAREPATCAMRRGREKKKQRPRMRPLLCGHRQRGALS
jgi:hypothetical protein